MLPRLLKFCFIAGILLGSMSTRLWSAPKIDTLLPPTTVLSLNTDDVPQVRKAWNETSLGQLFSDPEMQPFLDEVEQQNDHKALGKIPPLGLWWEDVLDLSAGPAAIAVVPNGNQESSFVVMVDTTGNAALVAQVRERLRADFSRRKAKVGALKFLGTDISIYQYQDGAEADAPWETRYYFVKDEMMVVAESEFAVRDLLSRWNGDTKESLADQKPYQATTLDLAADQPAGTPTIRCFIDPFGLHAIRHKPKADAKDTKLVRRPKPTTMDLLADSGFTVIQGIGGVISVGNETQDVLYKVRIYAPGPLDAAAKMLSFTAAKDFTPPKWFPSNVSGVSSIQWDLGEAFAGYGSWFDVSEGGGEGAFQDILTDIKVEKNSPQVDIKADMIAQMTGPVFSATWIKPADGKAAAEDSSSHWIYAAKVKDEETVAVALRKMLETDPDILAPARKVGNAEVWVYRPDGAKSWLGPNLSNMALSVIQGYAVVASDFDTMQRALGAGAPAKPLVEDADWKKMETQIKGMAIGSPSVVQFRRLNLSLAESYALLQAGKIQVDDSLLGQALTMWLDQLVSRKKIEENAQPAGGKRPLIPLNQKVEPSHDLDFKKLPEFKVLQKHLGLMASETELTPDGWQQNGIITAP